MDFLSRPYNYSTLSLISCIDDLLMVLKVSYSFKLSFVSNFASLGKDDIFENIREEVLPSSTLVSIAVGAALIGLKSDVKDLLWSSVTLLILILDYGILQ